MTLTQERFEELDGLIEAWEQAQNPTFDIEISALMLILSLLPSFAGPGDPYELPTEDDKREAQENLTRLSRELEVEENELLEWASEVRARSWE
jgi:hypothetical protein